METHVLKIMVTGASGQLGSEFRALSAGFSHDFEWHFFDRSQLDIGDEKAVRNAVDTLQPNAVINCAAYTNVEKAESEPEVALLHNGTAVQWLAEACASAGSVLVHFSTDYVFPGTSGRAYTESDATDPLNAYGKSKLAGEQKALSACSSCFVLRVSWLYSTFGHNFYRTMLRLAQEKPELRVVADQTASPTYARHLAADVIDLLEKVLVEKKTIPFGLYHYSQQGEASWYVFAAEILRNKGIYTPVIPVTTAEFPTKAVRPMYSKLDPTLFIRTTGIVPFSWKESLSHCIANDYE